jgi:GTP pyrophosphokinase
VVKAKWTAASAVSFLAGIRITGLDDIGIISGISQVISNDLKVNMRSISVVSNDGMFEGNIMVFVNDTKHLETLMRKLLQVKGVLKVSRFDSTPD